MTFTVTNVTTALSGLTFSTYVFGDRGFNFVGLPSRFAAKSDVVPRGGGPSIFRLAHTGYGGLRKLPRRVALVDGGLPSNCFHSLRVVGRMFLPSFSRLGSYLHVIARVVQRMGIGRRVLSSSGCTLLFDIRRMGHLILRNVPFHSTCGRMKLGVRTNGFIPIGGIRRARRKDVKGLYGSRVSTLVRGVVSNFTFGEMGRTRRRLLSWWAVGQFLFYLLVSLIYSYSGFRRSSVPCTPMCLRLSLHFNSGSLMNVCGRGSVAGTHATKRGANFSNILIMYKVSGCKGTACCTFSLYYPRRTGGGVVVRTSGTKGTVYPRYKARCSVNCKAKTPAGNMLRFPLEGCCVAPMSSSERR